MAMPVHFAQGQTEKMTTRKWTLVGVGLVALLVVAAVLTRELPQRSGASSNIIAGLTIEEYPIVAADVDAPGRFEFLDRVPDDVLARRKAWREPSPEQRIGAMNEKLVPLGYRLAAEGLGYALYREEELIVSDLRHFPRPVSVNESGTDFALVAEKGGLILVQNDNVQPLGSDRWIYYRTPPVYLGDDLLTVERLDDRRKEYPATGGTMYIYPYAVKREDEVVYTYMPSKQYAGSPPVKRLAAWEGHWILETVEGTFMDGKRLDKQLGVDEVFHFIAFQGQPLFFFRKDLPFLGWGGKIRISYSGEILPVSYDRVPHYWCCEPATFNVQSNEHMLWFYALKDGIWHYVEIGIYDE